MAANAGGPRRAVERPRPRRGALHAARAPWRAPRGAPPPRAPGPPKEGGVGHPPTRRALTAFAPPAPPAPTHARAVSALAPPPVDGHARRHSDYKVLLKARDGPHSGRCLKIIIAEETAKHLARAVSYAAGGDAAVTAGVPPPPVTLGRPTVYEFMTASLAAIDAKVQCILVHALDASATFHARVLFSVPGNEREMDVDARPSDALNLAVRTGSPVYVHNALLASHSVDPMQEAAADARLAGGSAAEGTSPPANGQHPNHPHHAAAAPPPPPPPPPPPQLLLNIRRAKAALKDRTSELHLRMEVAKSEERYEDAAMIRDQLEHIMLTDRSASLLVALEAAAEDGRHGEAEILYEQLMEVMRSEASTGEGI